MGVDCVKYALETEHPRLQDLAGVDIDLLAGGMVFLGDSGAAAEQEQAIPQDEGD